MGLEYDCEIRHDTSTHVCNTFPAFSASLEIFSFFSYGDLVAFKLLFKALNISCTLWIEF